jgi:hypothetical protein
LGLEFAGFALAKQLLSCLLLEPHFHFISPLPALIIRSDFEFGKHLDKNFFLLLVEFRGLKER